MPWFSVIVKWKYYDSLLSNSLQLLARNYQLVCYHSRPAPVSFIRCFSSDNARVSNIKRKAQNNKVFGIFWLATILLILCKISIKKSCLLN
jgi:hypothetical protein